jgi:predicted dehydrogenase
MSQRPLKIGIVGAGNIATSPTVGYIPNMLRLPDKMQVVALADVLRDRAEQVARQHGIPEVYGSVDELLARSGVEAVVNITNIPAHADTSLRIIESGRHCVSEKPLATSMEEADALVEAAGRRGVTFVCAPIVAALPLNREVRRLIDAGAVGKVAFARVRSSHGGPASWAFRTDPTWFYQAGAGPLFDMGVYGIHTITGLLGPARRVVAFSGITEPTRTVVGGPAKGKVITVTADDNTLLMLDFGESTFAFVDGTYNVNAARSPRLEIFGRAGTISVNDYPAVREGAPPFEVYRVDALPGAGGWVTPNSAALTQAEAHYNTYHNACLVEHLVDCVREGRAPLLSAEHARHALEIMIMALESARTGQAIELRTTFEQPAPAAG